MISLQPFYEGHYHRSVEVSIFSVALFRASPTRISSQICIRSSNDDSALVVLRALKNVAGLGTLYLTDLPQYVGVPGFPQSNTLWEGRCRHGVRTTPLSRTTLCETVNAFAVS